MPGKGGKGWHADIQEQVQPEDTVREQCPALRVWDKVEDPGKKSTSFTEITQGSGKCPLTFQRD